LRLEPLEDRFVPSVYVQTNLASDVPGEAQVHDTDLVDAWGISLNPNGTFWVSGRETDVSTVYTGDVNGSPFVESALVVDIPGGRPTGQVFNPPGTDFQISDGTTTARAVFIFASETGHITGWNPNVAGPPTPSETALIMASTEGAVYTGLAIHNHPDGSFLYAADFANGKIDVFDRTYTPTTLPGSFDDPDVPDGYDPFNIWKIGSNLYVAYAQQDNGDALPDGGGGYISVFDTNGNLLDHLVDDSHLKEPWGMALAPSDFGEFSNALLVANTANGKINAFDPTTGAFLGRLAGADGEAIHIKGLWGLHFGNGTASGDRNALYFSASGKDHEHGLFGSLRVADTDAVFETSSDESAGSTGDVDLPSPFGSSSDALLPAALIGLDNAVERFGLAPPSVPPNPIHVAPVFALNYSDSVDEADVPDGLHVALNAYPTDPSRPLSVSPVLFGLADALPPVVDA
jgi:uncharacterized protein (TIGR03118 family)